MTTHRGTDLSGKERFALGCCSENRAEPSERSLLPLPRMRGNAMSALVRRARLGLTASESLRSVAVYGDSIVAEPATSACDSSCLVGITVLLGSGLAVTAGPADVELVASAESNEMTTDDIL